MKTNRHLTPLELLEALEGGRLEGEVFQHLQSCPDCGRRLAEDRRLVQDLKAATRPPAPAIPRPRPFLRVWTNPRHWAVLAAACLLLILMTTMGRDRRGGAYPSLSTPVPTARILGPVAATSPRVESTHTPVPGTPVSLAGSRRLSPAATMWASASPSLVETFSPTARPTFF
jgi:hypothetical protein